MQAWIPVVSWSLYGKASLVFGQKVFWNQMGIFYQTESCPTACISLVHDGQTSLETIAVVYERTKRTQQMCSQIGHNNTKNFLCSISSRHPLQFLEMVRWESVPRDSFARTWKLSSRLFSRPDWLPLGLRGWGSPSSLRERGRDSCLRAVLSIKIA